MARKSRKEAVHTGHLQKRNDTCATAIYARLSVENGGRREDDHSLKNQISICKEYVDEHEELRLHGIYEDNGETGTDFDRPGFAQMMADVRAGQVKCVVVKDLSRFGRDYIEAGQYLEKIFPFLGVRFISITDNYDSARTDQSDDTLMIPLKNMINAAYAKDISRKIISSFRSRQEKGEFLPAWPPYGYLKDEENRRYVIDEEAAGIVRKIFEWRVEGHGITAIQTKLEEIDAVTPAMRKVELGFWKAEKYKTGHWPASGIANILKDPTYTGCIVYGKRVSSLYEGIPSHTTDESEWRVFPDMHEPIIDRELFDRVQRLMRESKAKRDKALLRSKEERSGIEDTFSGLLFCGDCGRFMRFTRATSYSKKKNYSNYYCSTYAKTGKRKCSRHGIRYSEVCDAVSAAIREQKEYADILGRRLSAFGQKDLAGVRKTSLEKEIQDLEKSITDTEGKQQRLYENLMMGIVEQEEYQFMRQKYIEKRDSELQRWKSAKAEWDRRGRVLSSDNKWLQLFDDASDEIDRETVKKLIKRILVYEDNRIEIVFYGMDEKAELEEALGSEEAYYGY